MSSRPNLLDRSPGPASYLAPSTIGTKHSLKFSITGKLRSHDKTDGPGPGQYAPPTNKTTLGGQKYSFASRYRDPKATELVPGVR